MDNFYLGLKKRVLIPAISAFVLVVWFLLCRGFHDSYWQGTIHRVQTVDFNLLHHSLPTTLSHLIIADRADLIQKALDANFGLFGVVVTDPSGSSVLYQTSKPYHRQAWQRQMTPEELAKVDEPYDLLTDPPPLAPMYERVTPRDDVATAQHSAPAGRVLGRVYYVREREPTLAEDLASFCTTGFWEMSGAKRGYLFITTSAVELALVALLLVWLRRRGIELKQSEVEHVLKELEIRKKALAHLSAELDQQKVRKAWLEKEADQSYQRALGLKARLEKLRDSIASAPTLLPAAVASGETGVKVRPPLHPPSQILEEIESIIPDLTTSAGTLKSEASMLHDYCAILEAKQSELQSSVETAARATAVANVNNLDMNPGA